MANLGIRPRSSTIFWVREGPDNTNILGFIGHAVSVVVVTLVIKVAIGDGDVAHLVSAGSIHRRTWVWIPSTRVKARSGGAHS